MTKTLQIRSSAFDVGRPIPRKYACEGEDCSPAMVWENAPSGTKSLALICDDPDAPTPQPWVHWVICNIPEKISELPEGLVRVGVMQKPVPLIQGINSWKQIGYDGPDPPKGSGVHHYHFKLYALDTMLDAAPGVTKEALLAAMESHVLAEAEVIGTYRR